MYTMNDLFDKRSVVGARLEQILQSRDIAKTKLCETAHISRPTLDKLISGEITNPVNFEKHLSKVLNALMMTPSKLMKEVRYERNQTRILRNFFRLSAVQISEATGIGEDRIRMIEAGADATTAELRDIAACLFVSVNQLLGKDFFGSQLSMFEDIVNHRGQGQGLSGFWGHVGIRLNGKKEYFWYPITAAVREHICEMIENNKIVIPCMNNRILMVNMKHVSGVLLLDEACDPPEFTNWSPDISEGELPLVVYEALEDYFDRSMFDESALKDNISDGFDEFMERVVAKYNWNEDDMYRLVYGSEIHYQDTVTESIMIDFNEWENISSEIELIFSYGDDGDCENIFQFSDWNGTQLMINVQNIAMMDMPLLKVEEAIYNKMVR